MTDKPNVLPRCVASHAVRISPKAHCIKWEISTFVLAPTAGTFTEYNTSPPFFNKFTLKDGATAAAPLTSTTLGRNANVTKSGNVTPTPYGFIS
ncbi:MAG: hypothetical protein IIW86_01160 [Clostridia bacterium]|nr:hypothetical protein [Clostridia bacterium]